MSFSVRSGAKTCRRFAVRLKRRAHSLLHLRRHAELIERSGLFDRAWYLRQYPDVAPRKLDPIRHYLLRGARDGRDPSPAFSTTGYSDTYPDVIADGVNPLLHYVKFGQAERRIAVTKHYPAWIEEYDQISDADRQVFRRAIERLPAKPLISILMPVYDPDPAHLQRAIQSVLGQLYPHWELCISDDASSNPGVRGILERFARADSRIKATYRDTNGHIAANSNSALTLATGDYVGMLDHDDELAEHALFWFAEEIANHPGVAIMYCDEDKLDETGRRRRPLFKPDWNPAMIRAQNYVCHMAMYRRDLLERVGGFRLGFEGSQDHDLLLRCAERVDPKDIRHIPRILYHWREGSGSTASEMGLEAKPYAWAAGARAIQEHLDRRVIAATVKPIVDHRYYQVEYALPSPLPKVTVIIPTALRLAFVKRCMGSVLRKTTYPNVEFVVTTDRAKLATDEQKRFVDSIASDPRVRLLIYDEEPFNYARTNNRAVAESDAPIVCLLNDDVEVITRDWLQKLVARAVQPGVGAVGPLLLYPDDKIQHAGVILGLGGVAGHQFVRLPHDTGHYYGRALVEQDLSCVTAACMVMRREAFDAVGGFDERFAIAFNDVDLCLRLRQQGWRIIWTPTVEMYHHESASVGKHNAPQRRELFEREVKLMRSIWGRDLDSDPFFNPNLSLETAYYTLAFPPRIPKLPLAGEQSDVLECAAKQAS